MEKRKCGEIWNNGNRIDMQSIFIEDKTMTHPSLCIRKTLPPYWKSHGNFVKGVSMHSNFVKDLGSSNYVNIRHHLCYLKNRNQYVK